MAVTQNRPRHLREPIKTSTLWSPRSHPEPGFKNRGGSLYSYRYVGKHHKDAK